jgi:hypothetical protein
VRQALSGREGDTPVAHSNTFPLIPSDPIKSNKSNLTFRFDLI